ncbi:MAG: hypothetical protein UX23_C0003G0027 [Parcubacteria group bacterium GW2011_GWB1_45_9]|nr:MAG: hypothetical protein UX23_C0003G0027 [Parcubacteria group bacterium GW2011_GWB1_45_9]
MINCVSIKPMKLLAVSLILMVAGIAIFGSFAMNHGDGHGGCIASSFAFGANCLKLDAISFIAFHLLALKSFSNAILISAFLLAFLLAVFVSAAGANQILNIRAASLSLRQFFSLSDSFLSQKLRLSRWLSFHENSPNFS